MRKKKGQLTLKPLPELIAAAMIFIIFIGVGMNYGSGEVYQKVRISNENMLSANSFYSISDNARLINAEDMSKFNVDFNKGLTRTYKHITDPRPAERFIIKNIGPELNLEFENPPFLYFGRSGNQIKIEPNLSIKIDLPRCPNIETKKISKITLLPKTMQGETYQFNDLLSFRLGKVELANIITEKKEAVLEISVVETEKVIAYISPNLKSRRLACLIINNLLEEKPNLDFIIIPSEKRTLILAEIGVSLDINKQLENKDTAQAIEEAIKNY